MLYINIYHYIPYMYAIHLYIYIIHGAIDCYSIYIYILILYTFNIYHQYIPAPAGSTILAQLNARPSRPGAERAERAERHRKAALGGA